MPYIDRDIAIKVLKSNVEELEADPYYGPHPGVPEQYIEDILVDEVPVADVVEVVRCKDCIQADIVDDCVYCNYYDSFRSFVDYCSCGERKEGD